MTNAGVLIDSQIHLIFIHAFSWGFAVHQRDKHQRSRPSAKSKRPLSLKRLAVDVGKEREREKERGGKRKRECRVRSIFKLQNEFDWSENFSSNGKRNWI